MESAPRSASLCPACGKAVDPLRAGQVAIMGGAFRYFCDAKCKAAYVDVASKRPTLDAMTAEPPSVASGVRDAGIAVISGIREPEPPPPPPAPADEVVEEPPPPPERTEERAPTTLRSVPVVEEARVEDDAKEEAKDERGAEEEEEEKAAAPPPSRAAEGPGVAAPPSDASTIASLAGVGAGVLAAVVSLAGDAAAVARLPLALAAAAVVVAQAALRARGKSEVSRWVVAAPVAVAAATAAIAVLSSDARADAHAAFVGVAAAAALAADVLAARARRDVDAARAKNAGALAVRAKILRGKDGESIIHEVEAAQVKPGEQVVVEAGEVVAVDGIVAAGTAEVAPWHESPVVTEKREGDAIVAGATVVTGRLRVTATFSGADRAWLRLTQGTSSRIELAAPLVASTRRWIERGAPVAAVLVGGATYANNGAWIDVVIAACAGGFALAATSAAVAAGVAHARGHVAAQRRGIVYKDAGAFDGAARADIAVVCSRGTILLGEPEIVALEAITSKGPDAKRTDDVARVLALAAGAEMASSHPFAAAVLRAARARNVRPENVRSALVHSGLGVTALAPSGDKVIVGSRAFLLQEKVSVAIADARVSELEAQGRSVLLVAVGGRLVGLLALQDGLRPGARAAVQRLHDARIEPVLLSGEARDTCETIARSLDIEHVRPEILPADRGAEVRALADGGHVVAAVGHAASDDGALGAADVSVAMGAAGAAPGEWGVTLASDDVRDAALALTVPRACRERAKTALVVGAAGQAIASLGIAFGVAPPVIAPVLGIVAAAGALAVVRDPTTLPSSR